MRVDTSETARDRSRKHTVTYYRIRAARFRELAQWQDSGMARDQFVRFARQCDRFADAMTEDGAAFGSDACG